MANLQSDIDSIAAWVKLSGLGLNAQKTKFLLISRLHQPPPIELTVDGSVICKVPSVTYLAVPVSSDLSWTAHIDKLVCSKGIFTMRVLLAKVNCISPYFYLFWIIVHPSGIPTAPLMSHVSKLESVQKFTSRFVTRRWSENYDFLLSHVNWPN